MFAHFVAEIFIGYDEGEVGEAIDLPEECPIFDGDIDYDDDDDVKIGTARNLRYVGDPDDTQLIEADVTIQAKYKNCEFEIYLTPTVGSAIYAYEADIL